MGLLIKLQNGDTALKSLKFGKDRLGGGDSNQPYIKNPIIEEPGKLGQLDNDFILRGGIKAPLSAAEDVVRLTKYMFDLKSPSGLLFIAKQNLLSRIAPKTEASKGPAYAGGTLNEGVYTPLSTLAQAGVGFAGAHLYKQGLDPTGLLPGLAINNYEAVVSRNNKAEFNSIKKDVSIGAVRLANVLSANPLVNGLNPFAQTANLGSAGDVTQLADLGIFRNRLLDLWYTKLDPSSLNTDVLSYSGGPGSILGVGKTHIRFADKRTNNYTPLSYNQYKTWTQKDLTDVPQDNLGTATILEDFRVKLNPVEAPQNTFLSLAPNYQTYNIENNFNLGNPGQKGDVSNYMVGKQRNGQVIGPADKINASYIYKTRGANGAEAKSIYDTDPLFKDMVPFYIAILNNDRQEKYPNNDTYKKYMHFRAFVDSFSDAYSADWNAINYMGRAEKFYKYGSFDRKISMAFTVAAQSKQELTAMYDRLNFLASSLAPEYLDSYTSGYMAGNIAYITLGGYISEQPGLITSLTYDIPEDSPWEIGIGPDGQQLPLTDVRQLPHIIKVTLNFTPLHKFRVEKQDFTNDVLGTDSTRLITPGNQKYIDSTRPQVTDYDEMAGNPQKPLNNGSTQAPVTPPADQNIVLPNQGTQVQGLQANSSLSSFSTNTMF
jgi:hypothetical protein